MRLRNRLARLEGARTKAASGPTATIRRIMQPRASGPELVALLYRGFQRAPAQINRTPGEPESGFIARAYTFAGLPREAVTNRRA